MRQSTQILSWFALEWTFVARFFMHRVPMFPAATTQSLGLGLCCYTELIMITLPVLASLALPQCQAARRSVPFRRRERTAAARITVAGRYRTAQNRAR